MKRLILVLLVAFILGCTTNKADNVELPSRGFYMGVLPIPGANQSFSDVYKEASEFAEFVPVWGKPSSFYSLASDLSGSWGATFIDDYTRGNGMFPLIHFSFIDTGITLKSPPGMSGATLNSSEWRTAYKQAVLDVVSSIKPDYLSIGNEVNRWYEVYGDSLDRPNSFYYFVTLYEEIYDAVKIISPETLVFCTFAREIVAENREANLSIIKLFNSSKLDLLVLTSYPFSVQGISSPDLIRDSYYSEVADLLPGKSFGFSELGWPVNDYFGGEDGQAEFVIEAANRLTREQGLNLVLFGWAWLHDVDEFDTTGLIKRDGTEKISYQAWKNLSIS